ncbi:MAG: helix-turn-helix domain-containing protein [bacterium]|nr:helix-turn-helix domain-containing protein [bacterium]
MNNLKVQIGERIKDLRQAAELTQEELAERAGLSKGFISQVERGLSNLSIENLEAILAALNVTLTEFFSTPVQEKVQYGEEDATELEREGYDKFVLLVPGAANRSMEPALITLKPDEKTPPEKPFNGDEFGYVLQGKLLVHMGNLEYLVKAGESFFFSANHKHYFSNPGSVEVKFLWITCPPNF